MDITEFIGAVFRAYNRNSLGVLSGRDILQRDEFVLFTVWEGRSITASLKCSVCKVVFYCGRECQVADYSEHKSICRTRLLRTWRKLESYSAPNLQITDLMFSNTMWDTFGRCLRLDLTCVADTTTSLCLLKSELTLPFKKHLSKAATC